MPTPIAAMITMYVMLKQQISKYFFRSLILSWPEVANQAISLLLVVVVYILASVSALLSCYKYYQSKLTVKTVNISMLHSQQLEEKIYQIKSHVSKYSWSSCVGPDQLRGTGCFGDEILFYLSESINLLLDYE